MCEKPAQAEGWATRRLGASKTPYPARAAKYPPPPGISASLFSILCPQSIHNTQFTGRRKSLLLNTLRDSMQSILFKADMSKVFRTRHLSVLQQVPGRLIFKGPCCGPQAGSLSRLHSAGGHSQRWRLTPALPILFCGSEQGRGENAFRRTKVTTISQSGHTLCLAGCWARIVTPFGLRIAGSHPLAKSGREGWGTRCLGDFR